MSRSRFRGNVPSSREIRRMNQREAERQRKQQDIAAFYALPAEERARRIAANEQLASIERNGITINDLDRVAQEGYQDGAKQAAEMTMRNVYAAVSLALHELHGFGKERIKKVLNCADQKVMYALTSKELVQQVWDDIGLAITFSDDPLEERIGEKE